MLPRLHDRWTTAAAFRPDTPLVAPQRRGRWAVEVARSPLFDNCLTAFPDTESFVLPIDLVDWLVPGDYFVRVAAEDRDDRWREVSLLRFARRPLASCAPRSCG